MLQLPEDFLNQLVNEYELSPEQKGVFIRRFSHKEDKSDAANTASTLYIPPEAFCTRITGVYSKFSIGGKSSNEFYRLCEFLIKEYGKIHQLEKDEVLKNDKDTNTFPVKVLSEKAAVELLVSLVDKRIYRELDQAKQLCAELEYWRSYLELVALYLKRKPDLSVAQMRQHLEPKPTLLVAKMRQRFGLDPLPQQQPHPEHRAVMLRGIAVLELSWQELDELAQQLACLLSLFAPTPIPWLLVEQILPDQEKEALEDARDKALLNLGLIKRCGQESYQLNRSIQFFLWSKFAKLVEADQLKQKFCQLMVTAAQKIPNISTQENIIAPSPMYVQAIESWMRPPGTEYPDVATSLDNVATSLDNLAKFYSFQDRPQGPYTEAELLYLQAILLRERLLGKNSDVVTSLNNSAELYRSLATSLNNLAELYRSQGNYTNAESFFLKAVEIAEQQLGVNHPNTIIFRENLQSLRDRFMS